MLVSRHTFAIKSCWILIESRWYSFTQHYIPSIFPQLGHSDNHHLPLPPDNLNIDHHHSSRYTEKSSNVSKNDHVYIYIYYSAWTNLILWVWLSSRWFFVFLVGLSSTTSSHSGGWGVGGVLNVKAMAIVIIASSESQWVTDNLVHLVLGGKINPVDLLVCTWEAQDLNYCNTYNIENGVLCTVVVHSSTMSIKSICQYTINNSNLN